MLSSSKSRLQSLAFLIVILALLEGLIWFFKIPTMLLPAPSAIGQRIVELLASGQIWPHFQATTISIVTGLVAGTAAGLICGGTITLVPALERLVYPYVVALQTVPKIAVAPLFLIWFGYGLTSKIIITALVCFFPVLVSVMAGYRSTDHDQLEMMRSFGASPWQILIRLRLPSALVVIFAGIEIAAVLAVIGAIVGEFVGAQVGLGYLITVLNFNLDVAGVFATLIFLSLIGIVIHSAVKLVGRRLVFWVRSEAPPLIA
jgi:NitT/TauT family transport system permease protein